MNEDAAYSLEPIGNIHCEQQHRFESPRQGVCNGGQSATLKLFPHLNHEQALQDLDGFDRLWVLYIFDRNKLWIHKTRPPDFDRKGLKSIN